jgi:hypothetical protein
LKTYSALFTALCVAAMLIGCSSVPGNMAESQKTPQSAVQSAPAKVKTTRIVRTPVLVKESSFFADGHLDEYTIFTFAADKTTLQREERFDAVRPQAVETINYEYSHGKPVSRTTLDVDGKIKYSRRYETDAAGRITSDAGFDSKGKSQSLSRYAYDAAGRRTEWKTFDAAGALLETTGYIYKADRLVSISMKNAQLADDGAITVEYNAAGQQSKRSYVLPGGALEKYETFEYTDGTLTTESRFLASDALVSKVLYSYDERGACTGKMTVNAAGKTIESVTFEYIIRETTVTE